MAEHQKYWLVVMPLSQYKEDVKKLARDNNLAIIDARFSKTTDQNRISLDTPALTKKRKKKAVVNNKDTQAQSTQDSML
jgi:hypothetical protein